MSLNTNFNVSPYYDDYDENKKFHRILFKPAVALQARELTQLQTILQKQVERFGNNIYKEGTIIEGCSIQLDQNYDFIKIGDLQTNGQPVAPSTYKGLYAKGAVSNVTAIIQEYADGLVSQDPNLTTLYIDYLTTGASGEKVFNTSENIEIYPNTDFTTASYTVTVAGAQVSDANTCVGKGYAVNVSDGIIYSKGHFLLVSSNTVVASKYSNTPDNVSIGFDVTESIIASTSDTSLLDNASGYNNENAPGADRLKLDPYLVAIPTQDARSNGNFLSIMDFQNGLPIAKKLTTQFNVINDEMARRTFEESGNYTIKVNELQAEAIAANTTHFNIMVGPGLHYVNGNRSEQFNTTRLPVQKATAFANSAYETITQNLGNYLIVDELVGTFSSNTVSEVSLRNTAGTSATDGDNLSVAPGTEIGKAHVRGFEYHDGVPGQSSAQYKLYLFNIRMNAGKAFRNVRAVHISGQGTGDAVLENSRAVLKENPLLTGLFQFPRPAIKSTSSTDFIFRTQQEVTAANNDHISVSSVTGVFPYSGSLSNSQKREFIIVPTLGGASHGGLANNVPVDTDLVTITVSSGTATIDLSGALSSNLSSGVSAFRVVHNEKKANVTPIKKTKKTVYVKIDCSNNAGGIVGPYSLGMPDVISVDAVYQGNQSYANTNTDNKSGFQLEINAEDTHYGLSQLSLKTSTTLVANDRLLVKMSVLQADDPSDGKGFYTVSSYYQSNGVDLLEPQDIPVYESPSGYIADLRNAYDIRPQVANTAAFSTTEAGATINPSNIESFGSIEHFLAAPNKQFTTDYEYYLGRIDKLAINEQGYLTTKRGTPGSKPLPPQDIPNSLNIGTIVIPPYPSLTSKETRTTSRRNESITITPENTRRYTMAEIAKLDKRLKNIEYYTTLSQLEQKTQNMAITDANGNDRFKNGILVDPATDFKSADVNNREFSIGIDPTATEFIPRFKQEGIDLIVANTNNVIELDGAYTLSATESLIIDQGVATNHRPCTESYYKFIGKIKLNPTYDSGYDETVVGTKDVFVDTSTGMNDLLDNLNELYPLTRTNIEKIGTSTDVQSEVDVTSDTNVNNYGYWGWKGYNAYNYYTHKGYNGYYGNYYGDWWGGWYGGSLSKTTETAITTTTTTTTDTYLKTTQQLSMGYEQSTSSVGDFVTDVSFSPFMRPKRVRIIAYGLRPDTRHYFFFDNTDINANVAPGTADSVTSSGGQSLLLNPKNIQRGGDYGDAISSDGYGVLQAIFDLPKETFLVGDRKLVVADVSSLSDLEDSTSTASANYNAYNYSVEKENVTLTTRQPTFDFNTTKDTYKEQTIDVDTTINITNTYAWNYYWNNTYHNYINTDSIGAGQDSSNNQYYPYTNNDITVVTTNANTTTGTGSKAESAITGGGGGRPREAYVGSEYLK